MRNLSVKIGKYKGVSPFTNKYGLEKFLETMLTVKNVTPYLKALQNIKKSQLISRYPALAKGLDTFLITKNKSSLEKGLSILKKKNKKSFASFITKLQKLKI